MIFLTWAGKILFILLATELLLACRSPLQVSGNLKENESKLSGTIVFWYALPESNLTESAISQYREVFTRYSQKFTSLYPQVKLIMESRDEDQLVEDLKREVEKGLGPDLIYTRSVYVLPLIQAKVLLPLDKDSINLSQFRSEALKQAIYQERLYGVPLDLNTQVLCYNKKKVKKLPETLFELINQARTGYSVGIVSRFEDVIWGIRIFGGQLLDAQGRINLDEGGGWSRWMKWLKNAKQEPNVIFNEEPVILENAFIEQQLAYLICWSYDIPFFRDSLGDDKFGVALLPNGENQPAAPPLVTYNLLFSSASSPTQTQIALRFAQFLTNTQQQTELTTSLRAVIPANKEVIIDPRLFPIQGILQQQSRNVTVFSLDKTAQINTLRKYGEDFYTKVMAGEISPEQAATQLTQTVNSQLKNP